MSIDPKTARLCERCATPGVPYGMHTCRECRALYCTPACAVADWRSGGHRGSCAAAADAEHFIAERFVAAVAYGLRASHLTACVLCSCGGRKPNLDPRLRALGLEPVSVVQACAGTRAPTQACAGAISVAADRAPPTARAAAIAAAIAAETDRRAERDAREFEALFDQLSRAIRSGSINVDAAAVQRFWKVCRLLFKSLIRMPSGDHACSHASTGDHACSHASTGDHACSHACANASANDHASANAHTDAHASAHASAVRDDLLAILRKWADVGQKCADMFAESNTPAAINGIDYQLVFRALQESIREL